MAQQLKDLKFTDSVATPSSVASQITEQVAPMISCAIEGKRDKSDTSFAQVNVVCTTYRDTGICTPSGVYMYDRSNSGIARLADVTAAQSLATAQYNAMVSITNRLTSQKQDKLIAGENICINGSTISAGTVAVDAGLDSTSPNPVQNKVVAVALEGKQDKLTIASTVASGDGNPVAGSAVYTELQSRLCCTSVVIGNSACAGCGGAVDPYAVAIGYEANGYDGGVAVGLDASGRISGVAVGVDATGSFSGVAVGRNADGCNYGVAVGYDASTGESYGAVALGYQAKASVETPIVIGGSYLTGKSQLTVNKSGVLCVGGTAVNVFDAQLNPCSTYPVQNAALVAALDAKQNKLTAGANIDITNNVISVTGGGGGSVDVDAALSTSSTNPVQNKIVTAALAAKQDTLTISKTVESDDANPVSGGAVYTALQGVTGGGGSVDVDAALSTSSTNPVQNKIVTEALGAKQDKLTIETEVEEGNANPVSSGAVYTALQGVTGGGGSVIVDDSLVANSTNPVQSQAIQAALATKLNITAVGTTLSAVSTAPIQNQWLGKRMGATSSNSVQIGNKALAGTAISQAIDGEGGDNGEQVAVGRGADGSKAGTAVGRSATGSSYGAAVGGLANGYTYGAAVGYLAGGYNYGAAVGCEAKGYTYGAALGAKAQGSFYGVAIGAGANTTYCKSVSGVVTLTGVKGGVAVGYQAVASEETPIVIGGSDLADSAQITVSKEGVLMVGGNEVAMTSDIDAAIGTINSALEEL